ADRLPARRPAFGLRLEPLEDRVQPSTFTWINPAGGDWSVAASWQQQVMPGDDIHPLPGSGDDAVINLGANNFTVVHDGSTADAVHTLTSQASLVLSGGSLSFGTDSIISRDLTITGATLACAG